MRTLDLKKKKILRGKLKVILGLILSTLFLFSLNSRFNITTYSENKNLKLAGTWATLDLFDPFGINNTRVPHNSLITIYGRLYNRINGSGKSGYNIALEIDDTFSYKELQHLESLAIFDKGLAGKLTEKGVTEINGEIPVNPSGGSLGIGHLLEGTGLLKSAEAILQLRGVVGPNQVKDANRALIQTWRGIPTSSGVTMILSKEV